MSDKPPNTTSTMCRVIVQYSVAPRRTTTTSFEISDTATDAEIEHAAHDMVLSMIGFSYTVESVTNDR